MTYYEIILDIRSQPYKGTWNNIHKMICESKAGFSESTNNK